MAIRIPLPQVVPRTTRSEPEATRTERTADGSEAKGSQKARKSLGKKGAKGIAGQEGAGFGKVSEGALTGVENDTEEHRHRRQALELIGEDDEILEIRTLESGAPSLQNIDPEYRGQVTKGLLRRQFFHALAGSAKS